MSSVYPPFGGPPAQRCVRCGTPLPHNVVTCANCGTYNPLAQAGVSPEQGQAQWGGMQQQPSYSGGQFTGPQSGQTPQNNNWVPTSVPLQNNTYGTPYSPQSAPSSPDNFYSKSGPNLNNYYAAPQQNAYYPAPSTTYEGFSPSNLNGNTPAGYTQPPQKKRSHKVGFIAGILLLVVLLAGGAFAGYTYFKNHTQTQNNTTSNVTPTILSTPTVTPLFSDSFTNNTRNWDLTSNTGKFSVNVGGGSLVLEDDQNKLLWELLPTNKSFTDFRLDVNAALTKGDPNNGYGVLIRAANQGSSLGTYYRFELYGDGTYAIFKGYLDTSGTLQSKKVQGYTANAAIAKVGQANHITIVAKGSVMTMSVNGQTIATYTDDNYKGGQVALFVSNLPGLTAGARATFKNLAVFPAPQ